MMAPSEPVIATLDCRCGRVICVAQTQITSNATVLGVTCILFFKGIITKDYTLIGEQLSFPGYLGVHAVAAGVFFIPNIIFGNILYRGWIKKNPRYLKIWIIHAIIYIILLIGLPAIKLILIFPGAICLVWNCSAICIVCGIKNELERLREERRVPVKNNNTHV